MKKKALALAVAGALVSPAAFAAQDTSGMQYTSAAEGFYASIRAKYLSSDGSTGSDASIENSSTRFGVRGTNDLGGGMSGFYQLEMGAGIDNGDSLSVRQGHVGLRGAFGEIRLGSGWNHMYNNTYGSTDIANSGSGNLVYTDLLPGRTSRAIQYDSPDLNGFKVGFHAVMDDFTTSVNTAVPNGSRAGVSINVYDAGGVLAVAPNAADDVSEAALGVDVNGDGDMGDTVSVFVSDDASKSAAEYKVITFFTDLADDNMVTGGGNDLDSWGLSAAYSVAGFSLGAAYSVIPDGLVSPYWVDGNGATSGNGTALAGFADDKSVYVLKAGYAQDNWYVDAWYSVDNNEDKNRAGEGNTEIFSIGGGVAVDKVNVYFLHENKEYSSAGYDGSVTYDANNTDHAVKSGDDAYSTFGVQYNMGSNTRVWIEYNAQDLDSDANADDIVNIGLRHDF